MTELRGAFYDSDTAAAREAARQRQNAQLRAADLETAERQAGLMPGELVAQRARVDQELAEVQDAREALDKAQKRAEREAGILADMESTGREAAALVSRSVGDGDLLNVLSPRMERPRGRRPFDAARSQPAACGCPVCRDPRLRVTDAESRQMHTRAVGPRDRVARMLADDVDRRDVRYGGPQPAMICRALNADGDTLYPEIVTVDDYYARRNDLIAASWPDGDPAA